MKKKIHQKIKQTIAAMNFTIKWNLMKFFNHFYRKILAKLLQPNVWTFFRV